MQKTKNRIAAIAIAIFLMLSMSASTMLLPNVSAPAATVWTLSSYPQYAFIAAGPNPIGVGQSMEIDMWLSTANPQASGYNAGKWDNYTLNIWMPDGTLITLGPYLSDSNALKTIYYTPDTVGTYYLQFSFPGEMVNGTAANAWFGPAISQKISETVQQDQVPWFPQALPTAYWTRPISAINRNWMSISGDWLMKDYDGQTKTNPYTTAPNSAHILWVQNTGIIGGLAGGVMGDLQYKVDQNNQAPITLAGRLYNDITTPYGTQFTCTDLATGKLLWTQNGSVTIGMEYYYTLDGGVYPYLWTIGSSTWTMYSASTGGVILTLTGALPSGTSQAVMYDNKTGDLLCYTYSPNNWLAMWNSSKVITLRSPPTTQPALNWLSGIQWNVTTPNLGVALTFGGLLSAGGANLWGSGGDNGVSNGVIIASDQTTSPVDNLTVAAFSTLNGNLLWGPINLPTHVPGMESFSELGPGDGHVYNGILLAWNKVTLQWYAYNSNTGAELWQTTPETNLTGMQALDEEFATSLMSNGVLYASYASGYVRAFNLTNGNLLWTWNDEISGTKATEPYTSRGGSFTHATATLADGKLYLETYYSHEPLPLPQNDALYCLNATTGTEIWNIGGYFGYYQQSTPISNGYIVSINAYDNQMYCFGQGPSATTVSAPNIGVTTATPVTITGTVLDTSAGTKQEAVAANFPNGLPCVSDASMTQWMEYVYEQQSMPTNATGVPVTLSVIDSNGNYRQIGTTTTNPTGTFGFTWTPDIPGNYTVIATFAGSGSYYGSSAQTYFYASATAPTASPYPVVNLPPTETYFAISTVAIIIAIAIIGALIMLMLRKRP